MCKSREGGFRDIKRGIELEATVTVDSNINLTATIPFYKIGILHDVF